MDRSPAKPEVLIVTYIEDHCHAVPVPINALAGTAQGMTISPNQTLTLRAVNPEFGGVAGSIISLGQRMGTAVGTAMVPGVLFWVVASTGDWVLAFRAALGLIAVLAGAALAFSVMDRRREIRCARSSTAQ